MLILISGLPGSGKSFFAEALCKKIGAEYLSSDIIRKRLRLRSQYDERTKQRVYDEMFQRCQQYIDEGRTTVLDATFYKRAVRDLFIQMAEERQVPYLIIQVKADENTIKSRLLRKRTYSEADFEVYKKIRDCFEPFEEDYLELYSDKMTLQEMFEKTIQFIERIPES